MLDSAGKRVAEQGQLQFLAERRERLDIPDGWRQRIPRARRSHRKRAVTEGGSTCQRHAVSPHVQLCTAHDRDDQLWTPMFVSSVELSLLNVQSVIFQFCIQGRTQDFISGGVGAYGERGRLQREPITGDRGRSPQRGPGAEPLVGGQGAESILL